MFSLHPLCLSNSVGIRLEPWQHLTANGLEQLCCWNDSPTGPALVLAESTKHPLTGVQKGLAPTLRCCFSAGGCYFRIVFRFVHWTCWVEILQWEERDYTRHTTAHCENSELVRNPVRHLRCSAAPANLTPNTDKSSVDTPCSKLNLVPGSIIVTFTICLCFPPTPPPVESHVCNNVDTV